MPDASGSQAAPPATKSDIDPAKRRLFIAVAVAVIALVIIGVAIWWLIARNYESTDDAYIDTHMVFVSPQIAGRVLHVAINDNMRVQAGQVLVEIDQADAAARSAKITAQVADARAQLAQTKVQVRVRQDTYQQAVADVTGATAKAVDGARDLARYRKISETMPAAVAAKQVDQAEAAAINSAALRDAAEHQAKAAQAQIDAAQTQVAGAQARLTTAEAQLHQASLNLGYTQVLAPTAGTIAHESVAVGDYLQPGQEMMAIVPFDIWITANFKETQLALIRPGQKVDIEIDAYPSVRFYGHVDSIERGAGEAFSLLPPENSTGNFVKVVQRVPVKIMIDGPKDDRFVLGPGMSANPSVHIR